MTERSDQPDGATLLPEETAHRILARAVELDAAHASDVPLVRLREIAREAGIGGRAFELALQEFQSSAVASDTEEPRTGGRHSVWSRVEPFVRNAGAFAAAMAIIGTANRAALSLGSGWQLEHATSILANILGVGVALRLRGRVAAFVLAVTAIAQLAEYPMHLMFGIGTVQGGATKWALIIAAALGLGVGALAHKRKLSRPALGQAVEGDADPVTDQRTRAEQSRALVLRAV
jgi:hypothetical protein